MAGSTHPRPAGDGRTSGSPHFLRAGSDAVEGFQALRQRAQQAVLEGLRQGQTLDRIETAVAAALDVAQVSAGQPLSTAGWRQKYLPEIDWRRERRGTERIVYALQTAAALRTGLRPDILDDTYHWNAAQLWPHAMLAAVMTIRAISDGHDIAVVCGQMANHIPNYHD